MKKIKFKYLGVFIIPPEEKLKGAGRILKIDEDTVFIELYHMELVKEI